MEIVHHPATNHVFGAPADMQDGSCEALPAIVIKNEHGTWACSYWRPNAEEIAALQAGCSIQLGVRLAGDVGHPVVAISVTGEPVVEFNPTLIDQQGRPV